MRVAEFGSRHLLWEQEITGSNPVTHTIIVNDGGQYDRSLTLRG